MSLFREQPIDYLVAKQDMAIAYVETSPTEAAVFFNRAVHLRPNDTEGAMKLVADMREALRHDVAEHETEAVNDVEADIRKESALCAS